MNAGAGNRVENARCQTYSGLAFDLASPSPGQVRLLDIAHSLAHQCRFNGACTRFYSVAEHSVFVALNVPARDRPHALLHDAAEAYVGDLVRPLKRVLPDFAVLEQRVWRAICERFNIAPELPASVIAADDRMLATERAQIMSHGTHAWADAAPYPLRLQLYEPPRAKQVFLEWALSLGLDAGVAAIEVAS